MRHYHPPTLNINRTQTTFTPSFSRATFKKRPLFYPTTPIIVYFQLSCFFFIENPASLFPHSKEFVTDPLVRMDNTSLVRKSSQSIRCGVFFEPSLNFAEHCQRTSAKASRRIAIPKALSGTNWDQSKEMLLVTYKALVRPILDYGLTKTHATSFTSLIKLQIVQNAALSTITRCTKLSASEHLHSE